MYVWKNTNRRDRRNFLTSGASSWGPNKEASNTLINDELIRIEREKDFVKAFVDRIRNLIISYLETNNGVLEINSVIEEIDKMNIQNSRNRDPKEVPIPPEMKKRDNIYQIFRTFDTDGSETIDRDELIVLLAHLNIPIKSEEFAILFNRILGPDNITGEINFDMFYQWFLDEAENQKKKAGMWSFLKSKSDGVLYSKFKRMVLEVEARNLILDKVLYETERDCRLEFRVAHPPYLPCEECNECFVQLKELLAHKEVEVQSHQDFAKKLEEMKSKFVAVENAFLGVNGRKLKANRLLYSVELNGMESRLRAVSEAPYRPHISDPNNKREGQLLQGSLVVGYDPRGGIRPLNAQYRLHAQSRTQWGLDHDQMSLRNTMVELNYICDEPIDVISNHDTSQHVEVSFTWLHYVHLNIYFKSECNDWKMEMMLPADSTGKYQIVKHLAPGRYRYRYVVDGVETTDSNSSTILDENGVLSNVILVINTKTGCEMETKFLKLSKNITLRNVALYDDGVWALRTVVKENTFIEVLDLCNNNISDEGVGVVTEICKKLLNLHTLKLNSNGFSFDGCRFIANTFANNSTIQHLQLSNNRIGDDGVEALCGLLKHHTSLQSLYLDCNQIGDDGCEVLGLHLTMNRSLILLSLSGNRIRTRGAERLGYYLRSNGSLQELNVSGNPLGPEGVKFFGDLLTYSDTLKSLDLSSTQMMLNKSMQGLHSLTISLRKNKALKILKIRSNNLNNDNALELAYVMSQNRSLTVLDTSYNKITTQWYLPDTYLKTKLLAKMPTLETSQIRNRDYEKDPILSVRFAAKQKHPVKDTDSYVGLWTDRRKWLNDKVSKVIPLTADEVNEKSKIAAEEDYIYNAIKKTVFDLTDFLSQRQGIHLVKHVAKVITSYISIIGKSRYTKEMLKEMWLIELSNATVVSDPMTEKSKIHADDVGDTISLGSDVDYDDIKASNSSHANVIELQDNVTSATDSWITACHLAMLSSFLCEANVTQEVSNKAIEKSSSSLDTSKLPDINNNEKNQKEVNSIAKVVALDASFQIQVHAEDALLLYVTLDICLNAFRMLGITLSDDTKEKMLTKCMLESDTIEPQKLSVKKIISYYVQNYITMIQESGSLSRLSKLVTLSVKKPYHVARKLILDNAIYAMRSFARKEFRQLNKHLSPKFICNYCSKCFLSKRSLDHHCSKKNAHAKYHHSEDIYLSQNTIMRRAKYLITGMWFPCFYELCSIKQLPQYYSPQIFDNRENLGRPFAVVEPDQIYRAEDILGDWIQVRTNGTTGWTKLKIGKVVVMKPSLEDRKQFWDTLVPFTKPTYYMVSDVLPDHVEIKVRRKPLAEAEICGILKKGMVVIAGSLLNSLWLQVVYEDLEAAWVVVRSGEISLLEELHVSLQQRMPNIMARSPYMVPPEYLVVSFGDIIGEAAAHHVLSRQSAAPISRGKM